MEINPGTLVGKYVCLEPVQLAHVAALWRVGADAEIWRYLPYTIQSEDEMRAFITAELDKQQRGVSCRFVTLSRHSGQPVGSTSYLNIDHQHQRLEIGGTWVTPAWQRSVVNTEAKYLQLTYAFETLQCIRVEFKTDALNSKSRRAIARIGATEEGIFRQHMIMPGGRLRDSVYCSILNREWPAVKAHLEHLMASYSDDGSRDNSRSVATPP